jgi:hypothetical protein
LITILVAFPGLPLVQPAFEIAVLLSFGSAFAVAVLVLMLVLIFVLTAAGTISRLIALPDTIACTVVSSVHGCISRTRTTSLRTSVAPAFTRYDTAGCCEHCDCKQNAAEYVPGIFIHVIFPL